MTQKRGVTLDPLREHRQAGTVDMEWRKEFLQATRVAQTTAQREHLLGYIERLSPPCRDQYLQHRRQQIKKEMQE